MSTILSAVIAIILTAILVLVGISYIDWDEASATQGSSPLAAQAGDIVEAARRFRNIRGDWPTSLDDLASEVDVPTSVLPGMSLEIKDGFACVVMPLSLANERAGIIARDRFAVGAAADGQRVADVSNKCGSQTYQNKLVFNVAMDGASFAPSGGYTITAPQVFTCGEEPPASAPVNLRGKYLACYLDQAESGLVRWYTDGFGLMPSMSTLISTGYVMRAPPAWPDAPTYVGPWNNPSRNGGVQGYYLAVLYEGGVWPQSLVQSVTANSNGRWRDSTYYVWHNYGGRSLFTPGVTPVPAMRFDSAPPPDTASDDIKAQYLSYWMRSSLASGKQWYATGNTGVPSTMTLQNAGGPPAPSYAGITMKVHDGWPWCGNGNICLVIFGSQEMLSKIHAAAYNTMNLDNYYVWHLSSPPLNH